MKKKSFRENWEALKVTLYFFQILLSLSQTLRTDIDLFLECLALLYKMEVIASYFFFLKDPEIAQRDMNNLSDYSHFQWNEGLRWGKEGMIECDNLGGKSVFCFMVACFYLKSY